MKRKRPRAQGPSSRTLFRPRLEWLEDRTAPATFVVTSAADSGNGTLRQAIVAANTLGTISSITFNIPGTGVQTILPTSPLPVLTRSVLIDGTSQPGYAGTPLIEIDGSLAGKNPDGSNANGLHIKAGSTTLAGLAIDNFTGHGVTLEIGNGNNIRACYIGLSPAGWFAKPNGGDGVFITNSSSNTVGGPNPADRDVISGNHGDGIHVLFGGPANRNIFQNNWIGTDASGTQAVGNHGDGINFFAPSAFNQVLNNVISGNSFSGISFFGAGPSDTLIQGNLIGTDKDGVGPVGNGGTGIDVGGPPRTRIVGNVISANGSRGINLGFDTTVNTVVQGNFIGLAKDGLHALGNLGRGLAVNFNASNALIGGPGPSDGNIIAYNGYTFRDGGVEVDSGSTGIAVVGNAIYANYGLGIDLNGDGVTPNAPVGTRSGGNNLQNTPILTAAGATVSATTLTGTLNAAASTTYRLEFFANPAPDASGHGEGKLLLGSSSLTTDGTGNGAFNVALPVVAPQGWFVSATATDPAGNTSEFSGDVPVSAPVAAVTLAVVPSAEPVHIGDTVTYTATITNVGNGPATGLVVTDGIPAGMLYLSATTSQGSVALGGTTVTATLGSLAAGATATVTVTVQAKTQGTFVHTFKSTTDLGASTPAPVTTHVTLSVPAITLTPSLAQPSYGQAMNFRVTLDAPAGTTLVPTGTVRFLIDGTPLGTSVYLVNGAATSLPTAALRAGTYRITVAYPGDANFSATTSAPLVVTVSKVHLTVTAENKSRGVGAPNPPLTYTIKGFVNGETASVVVGAPALSTTATTSSVAGFYPIHVGLGTLTATNYDFPTLVDGTMMVRAGSSLDFDGIGRAQVADVGAATGKWWVLAATGGHFVGTFGTPNLVDLPVPGDYDGIGHAELATYRPATAEWTVLSPTGPKLLATFGTPNLVDLPVPGDYDGTGRAEPAVFRVATGEWFVLGPTGPKLLATFGGTNGSDIPLSGDFDGVGHAEPAVYNVATGRWTVLGPTGPRVLGTFGTPRTDIPAPGDYDGDGKADLAVFRPSTGEWLVPGPNGPRSLGLSGVSNPVDIPAGDVAGYLIIRGLLPSTGSSQPNIRLAAQPAAAVVQPTATPASATMNPHHAPRHAAHPTPARSVVRVPQSHAGPAARKPHPLTKPTHNPIRRPPRPT